MEWLYGYEYIESSAIAMGGRKKRMLTQRSAIASALPKYGSHILACTRRCDAYHSQSLVRMKSTPMSESSMPLASIYNVITFFLSLQTADSLALGNPQMLNYPSTSPPVHGLERPTQAAHRAQKSKKTLSSLRGARCKPRLERRHPLKGRTLRRLGARTTVEPVLQPELVSVELRLLS